ncbi:ribbon-helix-helix domain-containing protein [Lichenibacterium ramalinae]|uniref:Antitoxin-like ribbon-helix-helix domain-containing protein n=1 Tax=Lichenibacterium ramalinae TaxID=2316527 RepID=A0A4Q2R4H7_9HYPH|nr:ribbon-helix-helix domain-containing protein [Lichenibacterium ramalinae]RYB01446.1 hypothetical protein D3272_26095 [Lichenibacterium ramalinae]
MASSKRGRSLADFMEQADIEEPAPTIEMPEAADKATGRIAAPMAAVVPVNVLVTPADRKRLRQLSLDADLSVQKLGHEAWNMLLASRGLPPLEAVSANVPSGRRKT